MLNAFGLKKLFAKKQDLTPVDIKINVCNVLSTCPDFFHVHPKELPPIVVRHHLFSPA